MTKELINVLAGRTDGFVLLPICNTHRPMWQEDDTMRGVRAILGTSDEYWALVLATIAHADHYAFLGRDSGEEAPMCEFPDVLTFTTPQLVTGVDGGPLMPPMEIQDTVWPVDSKAAIEYSEERRRVTIRVWGKTWNVPCHYAYNRLMVKWPKELNIRGAILVEENEEEEPIELQLRVRYPVKLVAKKLAENSDVYTMLERCTKVHDFFFADTDEEKLSVIVSAFIQYMKRINPKYNG